MINLEDDVEEEVVVVSSNSRAWSSLLPVSKLRTRLSVSSVPPLEERTAPDTTATDKTPFAFKKRISFYYI